MIYERNDGPGIGMGQLVKVFFHDFFFGVGDLQEPFVEGVDIVAVEGVADLLETKGQGAAAAAGGQHDLGSICANFIGVDDLVGAGVFEKSILVDAGGMGESIGAYNSLVGLDGHAHRIGDQPADGVQFAGFDAGIKAELFVLADDHDDFFEGGIAGAFAQAVDGAFDLAGAAADAGDGIGGGETQVVMTMAGKDGLIDIGYVVDQPGDLIAVLVGEAIAGRIGDIDDRGACGDHGFDHPGEVFVVGAAGVFGIEFDVVDEVTGPFDGLDGALQDLFAGGVEFVL